MTTVSSEIIADLNRERSQIIDLLMAARMKLSFMTGYLEGMETGPDISVKVYANGDTFKTMLAEANQFLDAGLFGDKA